MAWQRLVDDFIRGDGVSATVLLTREGLPLATAGISRDDADHLAALAGGLHSLARNAANRFAPEGAGVRQTIVELHSTQGATRFLLVGIAGNAGLLAVLTSLNADLGDVAAQMAVLARQIGDTVATRKPATGGGTGAAARAVTGNGAQPG
jgi:predicted regulator of Ras-like GTPase activity (Roadblock/LC7/MglB family)